MTYFLQFILLVILILKGVRALYFYQLKEYRIDRLKDFFKYDSGFRQMFSIFGLLAYIAFLVSLIFQNIYLIYFALTVSVLDVLLLNYKKSRLRFKPTAKAIQIFFLYAISIFLLAQINIVVTYLTAPIILLFFVLLFIPITKIMKERIILKATKKIASFPDLKIIAITGSYGKSSTKEFLAQILEQKYTVLKTPKNINTDIGVANLILSKLNSEHQIFIVEAGAYRIGEINNIVKMFQTDIAVITAIANQHLSLFGSHKNIQIAKSEIANTLKPNGKLYLNLDSSGVQKVVKNFSSENIVTYGSNPESNFYCKSIKQSELLKFNLNNEKFKTRIFGEHNAINLTACIAIAYQLGFNHEEVQNALDALQNPENILAKKVGYKGAVILDDSYNANPEGFLKSIDYASKFKHSKKILITMGLAELGNDSKKEHQKIAKNANQVFSHIFITKPEIIDYFKSSKTCQVKLVTNLDSTIQDLSNIIDSDTLLLIQNRVNPKLYNFLLSN